MAWVLIPAAKSLFAEFNTLSPNRDKASDGAVGDLSHQQSTSDHNPDETGSTGSSSDSDKINEVHAIDVDKDLKHPTKTMEWCVQTILTRCRSGAEKRLKYVIYNRRIWAASSGWKQAAYSGVNPHDHHAHFSFRYGSGATQANPENITSPWGLVTAATGDDLVTSQAEFNTFMTNYLKTGDAKDLLFSAVLGNDKIQRYDGNGVAIPPSPADPGAHTMWAASAIQYLGKDTTLIRKQLGIAVDEAEEDRAQAATQIKEAIDKAAADRQANAEDLKAIRDAVDAAGGSPELAPVLSAVQALTDRLDAAGTVLEGDRPVGDATA
jgi:hypothetical protein